MTDPSASHGHEKKTERNSKRQRGSHCSGSQAGGETQLYMFVDLRDLETFSSIITNGLNNYNKNTTTTTSTTTTNINYNYNYKLSSLNRGVA